jgi:hypothetical protein
MKKRGDTASGPGVAFSYWANQHYYWTVGWMGLDLNDSTQTQHPSKKKL